MNGLKQRSIIHCCDEGTGGSAEAAREKGLLAGNGRHG
jgi:hypothetical protein